MSRGRFWRLAIAVAVVYGVVAFFLSWLFLAVAHGQSIRSYDRGRVNSFRAAHHRVRLTVSQALRQRAQWWSRRMARRHHLADDVNGWRSCPTKHWSSNAGKGWDAPDIQDAFEASPVHRSNLLGRAYRHIGIGVATSKDGRIWITQEFCG